MQIKTCRKKRHVRIDDMKKKPNLICGKAAVGGNYNLTRDHEDFRKEVKIMVGGAPITQEFADEIGADGYSADAAEAAVLAKKLAA